MKSCALFPVLLLVSMIAPAAERWADPKLPVKDGVAWWLDGSVQKAARTALGWPSVDGRQLDVWLDGSGHGRHARQPLAERRPVSENAAFRFDGVDDFLSATGPDKLNGATLFIVAAPRTNAGGFRAFAGFHPFGRNDYTHGLNVDLGASGTSTLDFINIEGAGTRGLRNLLRTQFDFATWHILTIRVGPEKIELSVDGKREGERPRKAAPLHFDEMVVGARCYSNEGLPARAQGFLQGHLAEVLAFDRALERDEQTKVEQYLLAKHATLRTQKSTREIEGSKPLQPVANPAPVQMLVPGFEVKELPLRLTNINNIRYRADGRLVALGYDGRIHLLSDTDSDGVEDKAELFWDKDTLQSPIGMALTPPGYARGQGVFVAGKGKVSLVIDTNGDDRADEEILVASDWTPLIHRVDALGLAVDADGAVYFGLGTSNFTNGYLVDAQGQAQYDLKSERGTILRISPDFSKREIVATGIRFPVGLAFNSRGDLFCTDQEGATWMPNGNPFDELLHIEAGRHYGFPPRHPRHLPGVIDEPSVFDFEPQHQSTCGLFFNDGTRIFGAEWWRGDAFVCGESRGKLWRIKLARSAAGYVAQSQLVAHLTSLPVDAALSPSGDVVVACHSGSPDWGSGPKGHGQLFRIRHTGSGVALPVRAWSAAPAEIRIAFDRPLDPAQLRNLTTRAEITEGRYVFAADRYESLRPGYQVVRDQLAEPRFGVPILGSSLSPDRRILSLSIPPRTTAWNYAITLPGDVDVLSDLTGVASEWRGSDGTSWSGWLPHPDLAVAREFTDGSSNHDDLWSLLARPGRLTLRGQLDLRHMLQPAVQPGAALDHNYPTETVSVVFSARAPFQVGATPSIINGERHEVRVDTSKTEAWLPFQVTVDAASPEISVHWFTANDSRPRAFPLRRVLVPWAAPMKTDAAAPGIAEASERDIPEIRGGHWLRGRELYFGKALCSSCHAIHGAGGRAGPDLSNLFHRDYRSVLKDIREPNAALNPDHPAYSIETTSGATLAGVVNGEKDGLLHFADVTGTRSIPRAEVKKMEALPVSLMPPALLDSLTAAEQRDLMTFLLQPDFAPASIQRPGAPPARKRSEIEPLLKSIQPSSASTPFHIVLCAGPKDHGPGEHDYPLWQKRWSRLLAMADGVTVSTAWKWPSTEQWEKADAVVFYSNNPAWSANTAPQVDAFLARGGGVSYFHYAVDGQKDVDALAARIGLAWRGGGSKFRHGPLDLTLHPHPLSDGLPGIKLTDESYWQLVGDSGAVQLLATGPEEGRPQPLLWTREHGGGRIFVSIPGHYNWTFDDPLFRLLAFRGICWSAGQPMDRLAPLTLIGARAE